MIGHPVINRDDHDGALIETNEPVNPGTAIINNNELFFRKNP